MVFGRNTNLKHGDVTIHIQTEDRGVSHALVDTVVYFEGRVLHRRANNYFDLLPLNEDREQALKLRLDEQHRNVIEEIRSGVLQLAVPAPEPAAPNPPPLPVSVSEGQAKAQESRNLSLELANARSWLTGKRAKLLVSVRDEGGQPVAGASLKVEIEGGEGALMVPGQSNQQGHALIEFDMPRIISPEAALVIHAEERSARGFLRFALRAKPRVA